MMNGSDQDSDSLYVTNQPEIVEYAKYCYANYPTIVNNIPKEKNSYDYSMENFAAIDNNLAAAQLVIGESSNLAQLCLTYTYNFSDKKYQDYVCILSVLAQVAIDNAKRRFDIDLSEEIRRIKTDMDIKTNGYPVFWGLIRPTFNKNRINPKLQCPMNYIFGLNIKKYRSTSSTLSMSYFFIKHDMTEHRRKSKKVEELIQKYSLELYENYQSKLDENQSGEETNIEKTLVLRSDFDQLIDDIRKTTISSNYLGMMSWLINRAFCIGSGVKSKKGSVLSSTLSNNRAILLKTLYEVNPKIFLKCFKDSQKVVND